PADLPLVLLGVRPQLRRPRLFRFAAARGHLPRARATVHDLLFPVLPRGDAGGGMDRETKGAAGQHHRIRARSGGGAAGDEASGASPPRAGAGAMNVGMLRAFARVAGVAAAFALQIGPALAADDATDIATHEPSFEAQSWSFNGPFGVYYNAQLKRGFLVYKTICSNCHSMRLLSYRNLAESGGPEFSPDEVKDIAAQVQ